MLKRIIASTFLSGMMLFATPHAAFADGHHHDRDHHGWYRHHGDRDWDDYHRHHRYYDDDDDYYYYRDYDHRCYDRWDDCD